MKIVGMAKSAGPAWYRLAGYSALAIPLAMAALPVYVHLPKYYVDAWQVDLAAIGLILLWVRIFDAIQDPLLGLWSDHHVRQGGSRRYFVWLGAPILGVGLLMLFAPQTAWTGSVMPWLIGGMLIAYFGFSLLTVSYQAWGSELSSDVNERTRVTAWREGLSLIGVVLAAALPVALTTQMGVAAGYAAFAWVFVVVLVFGTVITATTSPPVTLMPQPTSETWWRSMFLPLANRRFRWLLAVFVFNGVAASIPATLVLFFIADVIKRPDLEAVFLISYFVAAAVGLPIWVQLAKRQGKVRTWLIGMGVAIGAFVWAAMLGPGDAGAFFVICILSGIALGADLALPPSILADVIDDDAARGVARSEGAYFGLWALVTKLNLALAAGIALPLVNALGYTPGAGTSAATTNGLVALAIVYAVVPSLLKGVAAIVLALAPFPRKG
jgi:glycoside/pentoside/hexuronide:cation symporter, GPH family